MKFVDDRTEEQKKSHVCLVIGTDSVLSGWGEAKGGKSFAGWACEPVNLDKVLNWVENRSDMKRVRIVTENPGVFKYQPTGVGHCHIYAVEQDHPAISS